MNKIKILLSFISGLTLMYAISFLSNLFGHNIYQYYETETLEQKIIFAYSLLSEIILFIGLLFISVGLTKIIKAGVFNSIPSKFLKIGGILFIAVALCDFIYVFESMMTQENPELWLQRVFTNFLLLLLGLTSLIVSDVLQKGSLLKNENDLTI
ncbi:DUF2975 domain-containing protein [Maribacter chungangensis]|uniref:DUF2975 domain-containing protein n=1 Tax=Maribacter chungangensis TaxID=1069117 RepID=A0ABW3B6X3_9FLAO